MCKCPQASTQKPAATVTMNSNLNVQMEEMSSIYKKWNERALHTDTTNSVIQVLNIRRRRRFIFVMHRYNSICYSERGAKLVKCCHS